MYKCSTLANIIRAVEDGVIGHEWNRVLTHKPVSFESSTQEIVDYLRKDSIPECSVCPESRESVEARQLSTEEVRRIKEYIQQRNRNVV